MPIYGSTLREAANQFVDHLNALFTRTLTHVPVHPLIFEFSEGGVRKELAFIRFARQSDGTYAVELDTEYGPIDFYIMQTCDLVEEIENEVTRRRLRTISYIYTLQPHAWSDKMIRWEFVGFPGPDDYWCRHHVQGPLELQILDDQNEVRDLTLNDWHLPTGWVTIEDVIRFCLHDLGSRPLSKREEWHRTLIESTGLLRT